MRIKWFYFSKMSSALFMFFDKNNQETLNVGKIRNYDEERVLFRDKNVFIFLKAFFTKMGYASGSRQSCLLLLSAYTCKLMTKI